MPGTTVWIGRGHALPEAILEGDRNRVGVTLTISSFHDL